MAVREIVFMCFIVTANATFAEKDETFQISMAELKEYFNNKIENLETAHKAEIIKMQEYYQSEITKNEKRHRVQIRSVEKRFMSEIGTLKGEIAAHKAFMRKEFDDRNTKLKIEKSRYTETVARFIGDIKRSRKKRLAVNVENNGLKQRAVTEKHQLKQKSRGIISSHCKYVKLN